MPFYLYFRLRKMSGKLKSYWDIVLAITFLLFFKAAAGQSDYMPSGNNITWHSYSQDASGSMPLGGGDIGLNIWVEKGDILFYIAKSDAFDENNTLLKLGRVRVRLCPNPFTDANFSQTLNLADGSVYIRGMVEQKPVELHLWVDVHHPVVHADISFVRPKNGGKLPKITATVTYESWRDKDHIVKGKENNQNSYKFGPQGTIKVQRDHIEFSHDKQSAGSIVFYHANKGPNVFDASVHQQGLDSVKTKLYDPITNRISGGVLYSRQLIQAGTTTGIYQKTPFTGYQLKTPKPVSSLNFSIALNSQQTSSTYQWLESLSKLRRTSPQTRADWASTKSWWKAFWQRSFIDINPGHKKDSLNTGAWKMSRNYQLFRYMLGCNAYGKFPTKFNGGLFTYDPVLVDSSYPFTPDFRNWGGGTFTAQNQRLVYYPMLKSGDFDMMRSSFEFYRRLLKTAELRSEIYWHHQGACFTEQLENFGLPNPSEYSWKRPAGFDPGMEYNAWLEYEWDSVLEFCDMILQSKNYNGTEIGQYIPLIKSCLRFFDEHYKYLAGKRGAKMLDQNGHLILYPGSGAETFKMAYNSSSTIAALYTVTQHLLSLPTAMMDSADRRYFTGFAKRIPPLSFGEIQCHKVIAPAVTWARINNVESPQLYPVFPWGMYGVGKPELNVALNTWNLDTNVLKNKSFIGWKQDNIFAARLGLSREAFDLTMQKFKDGPRRFPAFWGPGFDWVPDHNWGGSAMIGLQEMLLQTNGDSILLFAAWPENIDVHFKLHATKNTTVEVWLKQGKMMHLKVLPEARKKDVVNCLNRQNG